MQTAATLSLASSQSSSTLPAKKTSDNDTTTSFSHALANQTRSPNNCKEPEKAANNKTDSMTQADAAISKKNEDEALSDGKNASDVVVSGSDMPPTAPVDLLALVANINQVTNKSENTNTSLQLNDSSQSLSDIDISKESSEILDSQNVKLGSTTKLSITSGKTTRLIDETAADADHHAGLQTEFGLTAQKIHETAIPTSTPVIAQMPQAPLPLNQLQSSMTHAMEKLTPQVGSQGWDQALGQKIVWMVAGSQQSATLTLNPPDLGPLQIVLNVNNDQADATFFSTQPEVRQALETALPKLREMMNEAGIQLSDATVSSNTSNHHGASQGHSRRALNNFKENNVDSITVTQATQTRQLIAGKQMVDTFA